MTLNAAKLDAWITGNYGEDHPDNQPETTEEDTMTTAECIALRFQNDGQRFMVDGDHIADVCLHTGPHPPNTIGDSERYEFSDGSAIVITGGGWDIGHPAPATCHCWPYARVGGHSDECVDLSG